MTALSEEKLSTEATSLQPPSREEQEALKTRLSDYTSRAGFSCHFVKLEWNVNVKKLGLHIKEYKKMVVVSRLDAGSLVHNRMCRGDRIVEVDGKPVVDMKTTKRQIVKALQDHEKVTLFLERPEDSEAKVWARIALMRTSERGTATAPREKIDSPANTSKMQSVRKTGTE